MNNLYLFDDYFFKQTINGCGPFVSFPHRSKKLGRNPIHVNC
jgi:hypothetical protein